MPAGRMLHPSLRPRCSQTYAQALASAIMSCPRSESLPYTGGPSVTPRLGDQARVDGIESELLDHGMDQVATQPVLAGDRECDAVSSSGGLSALEQMLPPDAVEHLVQPARRSAPRPMVSRSGRPRSLRSHRRGTGGNSCWSRVGGSWLVQKNNAVLEVRHVLLRNAHDDEIGIGRGILRPHAPAVAPVSRAEVREE